MKINIIENNKTLYHIVHSVLSTECERYACMELQKYIYNSTNTLIPVFSDKCDKRSKIEAKANKRSRTFPFNFCSIKFNLKGEVFGERTKILQVNLQNVIVFLLG